MDTLRCQSTRRKTTISRKVLFAVWLFLIWFCLKSILVMYDTVSNTDLTETRITQDKKRDEWDDAVGNADVINVARISLTRFNEYVSKSEKLCWVILFLSIFTETGATTVSKYASDMSSPTLLALACFMVILSQCGLTVSLAQIDVGIAYAMWAAVGTATVSFCAMFLFAEEFDLIKVGCLIMIVVGVAGLNLREEH